MGYIGEEETQTERYLFPEDEPGTIPEVVPQTTPAQPAGVPEKVPA